MTVANMLNLTASPCFIHFDMDRIVFGCTLFCPQTVSQGDDVV